MFLIKTRVAPSAIHGNGVFACEPVAAGQTIWRFHPPFDQVFGDEDLDGLPPAAREFLDAYSYRSIDLGGKFVLSGDNAKFLNHSADPNTVERSLASEARRAIAIGEEITCDYDAFCLDGIDFDGAIDGEARPLEDETISLTRMERAPHDNLYTRLQVGPHGIGVFAIRDIPEGTVLFAGDDGETRRVPVALVERIEDDRIRQMYLDFCPVVEEAFVAPLDFNQLTMSWFLNHADDPNVVCDGNLQFAARTLIARGNELRADYTAFSEHASGFVQAWKESPRERGRPPSGQRGDAV